MKLLLALAAAVSTLLCFAGPAPAYTYHCAARAHAKRIVTRNAACATAGRVIRAYGTRYSTKRAAGFSCRVVRLDSGSNPVVECRHGIATIRWTGF